MNVYARFDKPHNIRRPTTPYRHAKGLGVQQGLVRHKLVAAQPIRHQYNLHGALDRPAPEHVRRPNF